ncbi:MAG: site-specific integrase [Mesorhizobium sp.]|nr:MAG: site-specific integrase [Mesorhizobium sp.]
MRTDYIHKHPGSANLYYIRDIPENVRHLLRPTKNGKQPTKWKISLRTAVRREAAIEARKLAAEHDTFIATGRVPDPSSNLSEAMRSAIDGAGGERALLEWLNQRASSAVQLADEADSWRDQSAYAADPGTWATEPTREVEPYQAASAELVRISAGGHALEMPHPDWLSSETAALDARRRDIERQLARDVPVVKALGNTPDKLRNDGLRHAADAVAKNPRDPQTITLSGVVTAWKEQTSPVAPEQYEYPVKLFEELNGALPVRSITVDQVRAFRDALVKMPPASGGKFDDKTMPEIIRLAERKGLKPLKASTAAKHFRCLKAIFTFAADDGYVDVNVAAGIKTRRQKGNYVEAKKAKRRTFSPAEMLKLFDAAGVALWRDKQENLWFLRLMTYTGARPEELAQLSARDIVKNGGHVCISLHDEGDNRVKNPSSVRMIPMHPELLRLGFEDFAKAADNRPYLFSTLEPDGRGRRYGRMQRRLTALINGKVSDDPRLVPYSLRHTFRNTMELTGAPERVIEALMGHSNPDHKTGRGYGAKQIGEMAEWIAKADPFDKRRIVAEFEETLEDDEAEVSVNRPWVEESNLS